MDHALKLLVEFAWTLDKTIDMPRLVARPSVDQKMERPVFIGNQGIQEVIPASEIAKTALVCSKRVCHVVPPT